jgi:hypothetical protein
MKATRKVTHVVFLLLGLLGSTVVPLATHADSDILGKFTLTSEAHWGTTVLPPGDYVYSIAVNASMPVLMVRSVYGSVGAFIAPVTVTATRAEEPNKIVMEKTSAGLVITSLYLRDRRLILHYSVPKPILEATSKAPDARLTAYTQAK